VGWWDGERVVGWEGVMVRGWGRGVVGLEGSSEPETSS